ncbi:MAG: ribonuclease Z [Bacteroidota bacterium]
MPLFGLTILGNNSAIPAFERHPTAQALYLDEQIFLIDCGEGTQMQLAKYKIKRSKINHIFISHLHGDHFFGLIGLISSMSLLGRETPLNIYGPGKLKAIIEIQLEGAGNTLQFPLHFHANTAEQIIVDEEKFTVSCFSVQHRVECWGYLFREKKFPRKIWKENVLKFNIPATFYKRLQAGENYTNKNGDLIVNELLTIENTPGKSYAYCADTIYDPDLALKVQNVSLLYHEATYLHDLIERAASRFHSTAKQAACIANSAATKRLLIGHFSSKYEFLDDFLLEAKGVFDNTDLAIEGVTFRI